MNNLNEATTLLNTHKKELTQQEYRTFQGQIKAGNEYGAIKGLNRLLRRKKGVA